MLDYLNRVITDKNTTEVTLYKSNKKFASGSLGKILIDDGASSRKQNQIDQDDMAMENTAHSMPSAGIMHEIWESFLAQNDEKYKQGSHEEIYDKVHEQAQKVEGDILGIKLGSEAVFLNRQVSGESYQTFKTADGKNMYKITTVVNGKVTSIVEKQGKIDLQQILNQLQKQYAN